METVLTSVNELRFTDIEPPSPEMQERIHGTFLYACLTQLEHALTMTFSAGPRGDGAGRPHE